MFAAVPAIAARLGLDDVAERSLLPALERSSEGAARVVRDRLLVEPERWFDDTGEEPHLASLQLGAGVEVARPASVRALMLEESGRLGSLYAAHAMWADPGSTPPSGPR